MRKILIVVLIVLWCGSAFAITDVDPLTDNQYSERAVIYNTNINELDTDKAPIDSPTFTGPVRTSTEGIQLDLSGVPSAHSEGRLSWNDDSKTLEIDTELTGLSQRVGQELFIRVSNQTGSILTRGQVVYVDGVQGNSPTVQLSDADDYTGTYRTIGVVAADISISGNGYINISGLVRGVDTSATTGGAAVYISSTPGAWQNTPAAYPAHKMRIGYVIVSHATEGTLLVSTQRGKHLDQLWEVAIATPLNGEGLIYESATGLWKNGAVGGGDELTTDELAAINGAALPSAANVMATMNDVASAGGGDMLSTNNLSDVSSAATSYGNIKQPSSEIATGAIERATSAEVIAGTDTERAITPETLTDKMAAPGEIGGTTPAVGNFTEVNVEGSEPHQLTLGNNTGSPNYTANSFVIDANIASFNDSTDILRKLFHEGNRQDIVLADMSANSVDSDQYVDNSIDDEHLNTTDQITILIDGGGSAITAGIKMYVPVEWAGTITQATMLCDQSGSIVVDTWKDTYANYPPTDSDTITASAVPELSATNKYQDSVLTGWTTVISAGDILGFNVDSATTVEFCTVSLKVTR